MSYGSILLFQKQYTPDVVLSLRIWRNAVIALNGEVPSVIGS
jgi:hypothetical protein